MPEGQRKTSDTEIMLALIKQVLIAAKGDTETTVTTRISVPMWRAFLRGCGDKNTKGNPRPGYSVFGSHTVLVKSNRLFAVSYKHKSQKFTFEVSR